MRRRRITFGIVVDDVADFLHTTKERFDIISADEKTAGKYASNSFSYSKEYYELLKQRLAPGDWRVDWVVTDREAVRCLPCRYAPGGEE